MILTDREIKISIEKGLIVIKPSPFDEAFSSTAVDLTLHPRIRKYKEAAGVNIDPAAPGYNYDNIKNIFQEEAEIDQPFILEGGKLLLGWTAEYVKLPESSRLAARVEGKSSLARIGLGVHLTAPTIHAGFGGTIQLEIMNHGPSPIMLRAGMKICQLIFETTLGTPQKGYSGQFLDQKAE